MIGESLNDAEIEAERAGGRRQILASTAGLMNARMAEAEKAKGEGRFLIPSTIGEEKATNPSYVPASRRSRARSRWRARTWRCSRLRGMEEQVLTVSRNAE